MRFDVITIFPDLIKAFFQYGVIARGIKAGVMEVNVVNLRDYGEGAHKSVDDRPYGGGSGMVMMPGPIINAIRGVKRLDRSQVVILSPSGQLLDQLLARELSLFDQLVIVCGRYEGIDQRVSLLTGALELSIGDYVLSGGELAALVLMEVVGRLIPGVMGDEGSSQEESFEMGLLEYPHYTRPREFEGLRVPEVLLSGNHQEIRRWRRRQSIIRTWEKRPELLEKADLTDPEQEFLKELKMKRFSQE